MPRFKLVILIALLIIPTVASAIEVKSSNQENKISSVYLHNVVEKNSEYVFPIEVTVTVKQLRDSKELKRPLGYYFVKIQQALYRAGWKKVCFSVFEEDSKEKTICDSTNIEPFYEIDRRSIDILMEIENTGSKEQIRVYYYGGGRNNMYYEWYYERKYKSFENYLDYVMDKANERIAIKHRYKLKTTKDKHKRLSTK